MSAYIIISKNIHTGIETPLQGPYGSPALYTQEDARSHTVKWNQSVVNTVWAVRPLKETTK